MERIFVTLTLLTTLAFADASTLWAANSTPDEAHVIDVAGQLDVLPIAMGIDPIITGPTHSIKAQGIMPLLDGCDADCQAKRLGLRFD